MQRMIQMKTIKTIKSKEVRNDTITYEQFRYKPRLKLKASKVERSKKSYTRKVKHKDGR